MTASPTAPLAQAARPTAALPARTYLRLDVRRVLRNRRALLFTVIMPGVMYLIFGATQNTDDRAGEGNVAFYVLVGMAVYGTVMAAASNAASVAIEQQAGWTRTLLMTPLSPTGYVLTKLAVALTVSLLPMLVLTAVGAATGAHAPLAVWVGCLLIGWLASSIFAAFGLLVGSLLRSDGALQAMGGILTLLAFAGNVFVPVRGAMLVFAQFTPMFGVVTLARYPLDHGDTAYDEHVALWVPILNLIVWAGLFVAGAAIAYRRSTSRQ
ncbi:ABC transporter permease [Gordonia sp. VNK21]|uniref:ABC transporter permease n=1 Tax=Gordonia sp. VNK21 TaxID=3382483 RepID=UPI0038D35D9A